MRFLYKPIWTINWPITAETGFESHWSRKGSLHKFLWIIHWPIIAKLGLNPIKTTKLQLCFLCEYLITDHQFTVLTVEACMSSPYCSACLVASSQIAHNLGARNITQVIDITQTKILIIFSVRWTRLLVSTRRDMRVSWETRPKIDVMRVSWSKRTLLSVSISHNLRVSWERAEKLTSCAYHEASNSSIGQHRSGDARILGNAPKNWRYVPVLKQANSSVSQHLSELPRFLENATKNWRHASIL